MSRIIVELSDKEVKGHRGVRLSPGEQGARLASNQDQWSVVDTPLDAQCEREMGLGSTKIVSLAKVRKAVLDALRQRAQAIDPIDARKANRPVVRPHAARLGD